MVSPLRAWTGSPSNWKTTGVEESITWVGYGSSLATGSAAAIYAPASPGQVGMPHPVGNGIADGDEPPPAAEGVVPPFTLIARGISAVVEVADPVLRRVSRTGADCLLAPGPVLVDRALPAVGAAEQETHLTAFLDPAAGG